MQTLMGRGVINREEQVTIRRECFGTSHIMHACTPIHYTCTLIHTNSTLARVGVI